MVSRRYRMVMARCHRKRLENLRGRLAQSSTGRGCICPSSV